LAPLASVFPMLHHRCNLRSAKECISQRPLETWLLVACGTMRTTTDPTQHVSLDELVCRNPFMQLQRPRIRQFFLTDHQELRTVLILCMTIPYVMCLQEDSIRLFESRCSVSWLSVAMRKSSALVVFNPAPKFPRWMISKKCSTCSSHLRRSATFSNQKGASQ